MDFKLHYGEQVNIAFSQKESFAVKTAIKNLKNDLFKTAKIRIGTESEEIESKLIVGTIGISDDIKNYVDFNQLKDKNGMLRKESFIQKVQDGKFIIAGSDRRGTIYGIYDFCEQIGVSPWYFFADVVVKEKDFIFFEKDFERLEYPSIEYRGIFINDEEELENWVKINMGEETIGVKTYEKIFELLLRLKANYIWPAMHVNSFNQKKENGALADEMGIVVGTSHCDMLMRSNNKEWKPWIRKKGYTEAVYDYSIEGRNREILQEYWRESVEQNSEFEVSFTLGMRGIHDSGFETKELLGKTEEEIQLAKIKLLETIMRDQKKILEKVKNKGVLTTFVPYKEVLELYDNGLSIPEEITLIWANDNYGHVRRYPTKEEQLRKGGHGLYYHNSYWSPPSMSYLFIDSIPLSHTRNELLKAYKEGIKKLWVMNVGAIKPLEQEIEFFLRFAWEVGKENGITEDVDVYLADFIDRNFTGGIGKETAEILNDFSQLTNVRKIENLDYEAFSQTAYGDEAALRMNQYEDLFQRANDIYGKLKEEEKSSFFQIVLMKIHAAYYTNGMFYFADRSYLCNKQGKMQAAALYKEYSLEMDDNRRKMLFYYNNIMAAGKWKGILTPEDFPPPRTAMHPAAMPPLSIGESKTIITIWNEEEQLTFVSPTCKWFEIANGGRGEISVEITAPEWISLSFYEGLVSAEERILVEVLDFSQDRTGKITIFDKTHNKEFQIPVQIKLPNKEWKHIKNIEADGKIVVEGDAFEVISKENENKERICKGFKCIKRLGRAYGNLMEVTESGGILRYPLCFTRDGEFLLEIQRFPSLNATGKIRVGISIESVSKEGMSIEDVSVENMPIEDKPIKATEKSPAFFTVVESESNDEWRGTWRNNVLNNGEKLYVKLPYLERGIYKLFVHGIDPYFAFSRFTIYTKERKENNLGGITGSQKIPDMNILFGFAKKFYGDIDLKPRYTTYAGKAVEDTVAFQAMQVPAYEYAKKTTPEEILKAGYALFTEKEGNIKIDMACALTQSEFAYHSGSGFTYCNSESYGRSGLAMYVREKKKEFSIDDKNVPSLHYKIETGEGTYTLWLLLKLDEREYSKYAIALDGVNVKRDSIYNKGIVWRYEAEQIWQWVPIGSFPMTAGQHVVSILALSGGMRYDRLFFTNSGELPPDDLHFR
ncbi:glycosyl hydrolase 115 family protein [Lachnospiraceae bacterium OttesenSCG-928-D06]|nr:glycosyl hydrolase 115 family protein [Lachnospiraceae bacterium OttesenSCG-928-D06]